MLNMRTVILAAEATTDGENSSASLLDTLSPLLNSGAVIAIVTALITWITYFARPKSLRELERLKKLNEIYGQARNFGGNPKLKREIEIYLDALVAQEVAGKLVNIQPRFAYVLAHAYYWILLILVLFTYFAAALHDNSLELPEFIFPIVVSCAFLAIFVFLERDRVKDHNRAADFVRKALSGVCDGKRARELAPYRFVLFGNEIRWTEERMIKKIWKDLKKVKPKEAAGSDSFSKLEKIVNDFDRSNLSPAAIRKAEAKMSSLCQQNNSDVVKKFKKKWKKRVKKMK